jgi:uncharacterized protein
MLKRSSLLVFIVLLSFSTHAQLLWKVSGNGLQKTSYLFGTHHLVAREQIPDFDKIRSLCLQSEAVVGEMDVDDPSLQAKLMQGAVMRDKKIKDLLSTSDYALVDTAFTQMMGVGLTMLENVKPMLLNTLYEGLLYRKQNGLQKEPEAVDVYFQKQMEANGKKVLALETVEEQIEVLFNSCTVERQAEILVNSIKEQDKGLEELKKLDEAYLAGDLQTLLTLEKEDDSMNADEMKIFVDNRNLKWMKKLPALMNQQSCFVAVGCLHLVGETGLINQLKQEGYTVEPVILYDAAKD